MDDIQKVLIKAGRKDLAQEYYKKIAQPLARKFNKRKLRDDVESALDDQIGLGVTNRLVQKEIDYFIDHIEKLVKKFGE